MMRVLLSLAFLTIVSYSVSAQTVTGHVTSAQDQSPLPGVSVLVKGTTVGTTTNMEGAYTLSVSDPNATLVFSFIGFTPEEVPLNGRSTLDVSMLEDITQLGEVVVTAFGIEREEKSLGYAVSSISADQITDAASTNFASALYGKAAGVRIASSPGGATSAVNVQVRGISSINSSSSSPLYVIDGVMMRNSDQNQATGGTNNSDYWSDNKIRGNGILDINPNDIASMTILKGASAAALYGSEASNGVIVITTKAGKAGKGVGIDVNYDFTVERVAYTPKYQNTYGPGYDEDTNEGNYDVDDEGYILVDLDNDGVTETQRPNFRAYAQFGPKMDGREVAWWDGSMRKYKAHPNNYKNFYQQGTNSNFNVALSGGSEKGTYRLSYTRRDYKAISRGANLNRNTVNFNTRLQLHKRLTADVVVQYINSYSHNRPTKISRITGAYGGFFSRADDMSVYLDKYKTSEGYKYVTYDNSDYNPDEAIKYNIRATELLSYLWTSLRNSDNEYQDRLISSVTLNYDIGKGLSLRGRVGNDFTSLREEIKNHNEYATAFNTSESTGAYQVNNGRYAMVYGDAFLTYNKDLTSDLNLSVMAGTQAKTQKYLDMSTSTSNGLVLENWFSIENSTGTVSSSSTRVNSTMFAYLGTVDLNYRDYLFLQGTAREEWTSTLKPGKNQYFYPSANLGFVFSEIFQMPKFMDFGKIRVSEAGIAHGTDPYQANITYTLNSLQTPNNGSVSGLAADASYGNEGLKPERKIETEVGLETGFLKNRLRLDVTYYTNIVKDQILNVGTAYSSGAGSLLENIGQISSRGIEVAINGTPVVGVVTWDIGLNFARNRTRVDKLSPESDEITFQNIDSGSILLKAEAGEEIGNLYAHPYLKDDNGNRIISSDGLYEMSDDYVNIGNAMPNAVGGISNTLSYKAFSLNMMIDYSFGGKIVSAPTYYQYGAGMFANTMKYRDEAHGGLAYNKDVDGNRVLASSSADATYHDGVILKGVTEDGEVNEKIIQAGNYYLNTFTWGDGPYKDKAVFDNDWVKMREVVISYSLPSSISEKLHFQSIRVSLVGRNLFYLYRTLENLDPEAAVGSSWSNQLVDAGSSASTRSYGFTLRAKF